MQLLRNLNCWVMTSRKHNVRKHWVIKPNGERAKVHTCCAYCGYRGHYLTRKQRLGVDYCRE